MLRRRPRTHTAGTHTRHSHPPLTLTLSLTLSLTLAPSTFHSSTAASRSMRLHEQTPSMLPHPLRRPCVASAVVWSMMSQTRLLQRGEVVDVGHLRAAAAAHPATAGTAGVWGGWGVSGGVRLVQRVWATSSRLLLPLLPSAATQSKVPHIPAVQRRAHSIIHLRHLFDRDCHSVQ